MKDFLGRVLAAAGNGLVYTLMMWGILSLAGEPSWMHHHLTDALFWTGMVYACGSYGRKS